MTATRPKLYRIVPEAPPGELQIRYGRAERLEHNPDIIYNRGDGVPRCDASLLNHVMGHKRLGLEFPNGKTIEEPSLFDELKARGYDITTLQFSIWKTGMKPQPKKKEPEPPSPPRGPRNTFTIFWKNGVREVFLGYGSTPMEAFAFEGRTEIEGAIFHWELGNNRSYVWDDNKRRWVKNKRPTPNWESK